MTTPDGAVVLVPPVPENTSVAPSRGCTTEVRRNRSRETVLVRPPSPGLRALRESDTVVVTYEFRSLPQKCLPVRLKLTVDASASTLVGHSVREVVRGRTGTVRIEVPSRLDRPDVVRATAEGRRGELGRTVEVRITG